MIWIIIALCGLGLLVMALCVISKKPTPKIDFREKLKKED